MSTDALELSPEAILSKHGIPERHARAIVSVYFTETWPRIEKALTARGLWGSHSRLRSGEPWKHAAAFNAMVRPFCIAPTDAAALQALERNPAVLIRRLGGCGIAFALFGHQHFDANAYRLTDLHEAETVAARAAIADFLSVDGTGEPLGWTSSEWFRDWQYAMMRTVGPFLSHARMERSMT